MGIFACSLLLFELFQLLLICFLLGLVLACFDSKIGLLHQFVFAHFGLFVCFLAVVCACPFDKFIHNPFASLNHPKL